MTDPQAAKLARKFPCGFFVIVAVFRLRLELRRTAVALAEAVAIIAMVPLPYFRS
jgi:hypothetical protein